MSSSHLFSFLDDNDLSMDVDPPLPGIFNASETLRKCRLVSIMPSGYLSESLAMPEDRPSIKKTRAKSSHKPELIDEFETEAKQEVVGSAGLTGSVETVGTRLELKHQIRHQVAVPPGYGYVPISQHVPPAKPARQFKFALDPFQQVSIYAIQRNESVLVSAHTSAGKTVVAEYAIAQALQNRQRVIYTSPIKALSNQKFRELEAEFGDVGLMTGDVTRNLSASCLILRSMLYKGSEIVREIAWVIFDEIHYMRDKERGVVWEETIILLPHSVRYVFLSATIPNAMQFCEWICKVHEQPCHVVYTDFRPTPLQHYLFPAGGEGIYLVVNEKGEFREDNFTKAMGLLQQSQGDDPAYRRTGKGSKDKSKKGGAKKGPSDISKIIRMLMLKNANPVIVFAFGKHECEALALTLSKLDFNSQEEHDLTDKIFSNAIAALSPADRTLPKIVDLLLLLKRGIGFHHGGLLPIIKEVVEILFQEGLIKVLFATETFSIGLNMPAKTVVFTSVRKFDGQEFRNLSSGEYIQMSGRAGRRGLDDRGLVIMMCDEKLEPAAAKDMIKGEADRLDSAFHIGYNMVLNLLKIEVISPEYMLEHCFLQFQSRSSLPKLENEVARLEESENSMDIPNEVLVAQYYDYRRLLDQMSATFREIITHPSYCLPFLCPGRLIKVKFGELDFGWGILVNCQKRAKKDSWTSEAEQLSLHEQYVLDVLLNCAPGSVPQGRHLLSTAPSKVQPCPPHQKGEPSVVPILLSAVEGISHLRVFLPKDLRSSAARETAWKSLLEVQRRFPDGITFLDPIEDMKIQDKQFKSLVDKIHVVEQKMFTSPLHEDPCLPKLYSRYMEKVEVMDKIRSLKQQVQATRDVLQMEELKARKRVLRRLGFTNVDDIVDIKGRVACEINTGDELLLTELMFNGVFNPLSPEQCAGLLSCFVFAEKSQKEIILAEELAAPVRVLQEIARRIAKVARESRLPLLEDDYVQAFKIDLMHAVVQWCRGASFSEICDMTGQFEGSIVRVFRRLQELLRQMTQASKVIGNIELQQKFERALEMLERPNSVINW
ncbi:hypothetical protein EWM64_g6305 [Hericium alpestre]|uniref:ATP-dependent RNA helicase DOB1 n=1 Tax=Hericium alpestre TaxID=135208 RepID=A0A4Y9ZUH0_9AGAM|nr:hypothetical protein EWM64_g6305 [Hericium alpestre]